MTINFSTLSQTTYNQQLQAFIAAVEGEKDAPYVDTYGNATIGWGFVLNSKAAPGVVFNIITQVLGVNPYRPGLDQAGKANEQYYMQQLQGVLAQQWPSALQTRLNNILFARAQAIYSLTGYSSADATAIGTPQQSFQFTSLAQLQNVLTIVQYGPNDPNDPYYLKAKGMEPYLSSLASRYGNGLIIPYSYERIALLSILYEGALSGPKSGFQSDLWSALNEADPNDARAQAWYLMRYTNITKGARNARRGYMESAMFGLYAPGQTMSQDEALAVYRVYSQHAPTMQAYDQAHTRDRGDANTDLTDFFLYADTLTGSLQPAADELNKDFGHGKTYDALHIWVASSGDSTVSRARDSASDLIIGGFCSDTLVGGTGGDTYEYVVPSTGETAVVSIDDSEEQGTGSVYVGNTLLKGGTGVNGSPDTWTDANGDQYAFTPSGPGGAIGTLAITQGVLGGAGNEIDINNFDLNAAQTKPTGYLGITFAEQTALVAGSNANPFSDGYLVPSNSSVGNIQQGTLPLTVYVSAASATAQTVTITMTQGDPSGFSIDTGQECVAFNGTATLTIPAGQNSLSFGLVNDTDVTQPETVQLTATITGNGSTATNNLTIGYVPEPNDPAQLPPSTITNQIAGTVQGGVTYYRGDGQNDLIVTDNNPSSVTAGSGNDVINLGNGSDTVDPGTGNDTIYGGTGTDVIAWIKGNDLIIGNGGQDVIEATNLTQPSSNRIFAGAMTDLATAIAQQSTATPSGQKGDFIVVTNGVDTIVGGTGNDVYVDAGGNNIIVCGAGNNIVEQDMNIGTVTPDWTAQITSTSDGVHAAYDVGVSFTGVSFYSPLADAGTDYIYGGAGNNLIIANSGNTVLEAGTGSDTIFTSGNGNATIYGGSANIDVYGQGGTDYINAGSGNAVIDGNLGSTTIIGGSGNDVLVADGYENYQGWGDHTIQDNYIEAGSGNTTMEGSPGTDVLVGGTGNDILFAGIGTEYLYGGSGNQTLVGAQSLTGGASTDVIVAGSGNDIISGNYAANATLYGGVGHDSIFGSSGGNDVIYAGDGGDVANPTIVEAKGQNDTIYGGAGTDEIFGGSGNDLIYAGDGGSDTNPVTVVAGTGQTTLVGGAGGSWLQDGTSGNALIVGGAGDDTVFAIGNDTVVAGSGHNILENQGGNVTFEFNQGFGENSVFALSGGNQLVFGPGINSTDFTIDPVIFGDGSQGLEFSGDGGDVAFDGAQLPGMISSITFLDPSTYALTQLVQQDGEDSTQAVSTGFNRYGNLVTNNLIFNVDYGASLTGGAGSDTISAWGDSAVLSASTAGSMLSAGGNNDLAKTTASGDTLAALGHGDTLTGSSTGGDVFLIQDASTVLQNTVGTDTVRSWVTYSLPYGLSILQLQGNGNLVGTGDVWTSNTLSANTGNDTLVSGYYADTLIGGSGNDTFVINNTADVVQDTASGANNVIQSSVSYSLPTNVNTLILTGGNYSRGTANAGNDTLVSDTVGSDTLVGGAGNDVFVVNNASDVVQVTSTTTTNTIQASVSYVLPANVQNLTLLGTANINATGNSTNGTLTANSGNDSLIAGTGNETLIAGSGNDTLIAGSGADVLQGGVGADTYVINSTAGRTLINLGAGAQTIRFGSGISKTALTVGASLANGVPVLMINDGFNPLSVTNELNASGVQLAFADGTTESLTQLVQQTVPAVTVTGANGRYLVDGNSNHVLTGGSTTDTLSAWGSNDTLNAGTGNSALIAHGDSARVNGGAGADTLAAFGQNDTLTGGSSNTTFIVSNTNDVVQDTTATASNTLQSAVSYVLPANVNTLLLTGSTNLTGTANAGNDTLISNAGIDTLIGGAGNDLFIINNVADLLQDTVTGTNSTVQAGASFSLPTNVNTLILTGSANLIGTGNGGNDSLVANTGNDTLVSGSGVDTLIGGAGNDIFVVNNGADVVLDTITGTNSAIQSSVSYALQSNVVEIRQGGNGGGFGFSYYTLVDNVNTLVLTGTANLSGMGNSAMDTLISNSGVDTLIGGTNSDLFVVNNTADVVQQASNVGSTIQSSVSYSLSTNVDTLILTGTANLIGTGNADNDTLIANAGNDTLVAGTGSDLLQAASGNVTLQFNTGFGFDTVRASGAVDTLSFGTGINPTDFTVTAVIDNDQPALMLAGDGGSIILDNALVPGVVGNLNFANGTTLSLAQFVAQAQSISATLPGAMGNFMFDPTAGDTLTAVQKGDTLSGWGAGQTFTSTSPSVTGGADYAWGNNDTLNSAGGETLVGIGSNEVFEVTRSTDTISAWANGNSDTVVAGGPYNFNYNYLYNYNSYSYSYGYSLPQTVPNLIVTIDSLSGFGNSTNGVLVAQGNNDTLVAGAAADTLVGVGSGTVFEPVGAGNVIQIQANVATDTIAVGFNYSLPSTINGLTLLGNGNLIGTANNNNDTLQSNYGIDTLIGGAGNDIFVVNNAADVIQDTTSGGNNTIEASINYSLPSFANTLILLGYTNLSGIANNNNDTLVSNFGVDTLIGGAGNDVFILNNASDVIQDTTSGGNNTIEASFNYVLPSFANTLILTGTANLKGTANSGNDTLVSNTGIDTLVGGSGNEVFIVNNSSDVVQDTATGANNVMQSSVSYSLPTNVNTLTLTGTAALLGTGNGGTDILTANTGNDTLVAGSGVATLIGGAGSDLFVINSASDVVQETYTGTNSTVQSSANYSLGSNINTLVLTGTAALKGTANSGNDTLVSNTGADTLVGGAGNDVFVINNTKDVIVLGAGNNTVEASVNYSLGSTVNTLILIGTANLQGTANSNKDTIISNTGIDTLVAGTGNDLFVINNTADVVQLGRSYGTDSIQSSVSYILPANIANLTLIGPANISGTGNSKADLLTAGSGYDTLTPGTGVATMVGGGATTFIVNNASDVVTEPMTQGYAYDTVQSYLSNYTMPTNVNYLQLMNGSEMGVSNNSIWSAIETQSNSDTLVAGSGGTRFINDGGAAELYIVKYPAYISTNWYNTNSTIQSSISFNLQASVETLQLTGTANLYAADNNGIIASWEFDTMISNSGVDTLRGGVFNDLFVVNNSNDVVIAGSGVDSVQASVSYSLPTYINILTLTGATSLTGAANGANDTLISNSGVDTLVGGTGNDLFIVNNAADVIQPGSAPVNNTIQASVSYSLGSSVDILVLTGATSLKGTANNDNDTLVSNTGADTLTGGTGNDVFVVNNSSDVVKDSSTTANNVIQSSVNYVLPTNVNTLVLTGSAPLTGTGNAASDTLIANSGNDTLTAGSGVATLIGGVGNDIFVVNNVNDVVQDSITGTNSTIQSSVSYSLAANVNTLNLGTGTAALKGTANSGNDTLVSNTGVDTLVGGAGNDLFILKNVSDVVQNSFAGTNDTINAAFNYILPLNVNTLVLTGTAALKGTANSGNDTLVSNTGADTLVGGAGNDLFVVNNAKDVIQTNSPAANNAIQTGLSYTLGSNVNTLILINGTTPLKGTANSGNDTLVSNAGVDTLVGGAGNDVFVVNNSGDVINDTSTTANNVIQSSVSFVLPTNVNTLVLTGSAALSGTGNSAADSLVANSGNDTLTAGSGVATLIGGAGNDLFVVNNVNDVVQDSLTGTNSTIQSSVSFSLAANVNTLSLTGTAALKGTANSGNDTVVSNTGVDTLVGGAGNDLFILNNASDIVQDSFTGTNSTISAGFNYVLPANVNTLLLTGTAALTGTANSGTDTLVSNSGVDTLVGGAGNDTFVLNNPADVIQLGTGTNNAVVASSSYSLPTGINMLTLTGTANLVGTANSANDTLVSNAGVDTLIGGAGNNTFIVNNYYDVVKDSIVGSNSTIMSSVTYVLPTNVNTLILTGTSNLTAAGNNGNDLLVANSGNDVLSSGSGLTTMIGGSGNDLFDVNNPGDIIQLGPISGDDTVETAFSYALPTNVNTLLLTGNANLTGVANNGNDTLISNYGVDTLVAGTGNDTFVINNRSDVIQVGTRPGIDAVQSTVSYSLPANINFLTLNNFYSGLTGAANSGNDVITTYDSVCTLVGGSGLDILVGGEYATVIDTQGQGALSGNYGSTLTGGAYNDFFAVPRADSYDPWGVNTGATDNVISVNRSGVATLQAAAGARNILSLGGGIDTEDLSFSTSANGLVLSDSYGSSITISDSQTVTTLQVIEQVSTSYNAGSTDPLRNQAIYEFNFASLVNQFNQALAANPSLTSWSLSNGMPSALVTTSSTQAYGGDLAYYEGLYGDVLEKMNISSIQSTLQNTAFGTGLQTIDPWSSISGGATALSPTGTAAPATLSTATITAAATTTTTTTLNTATTLTSTMTETTSPIQVPTPATGAPGTGQGTPPAQAPNGGVNAPPPPPPTSIIPVRHVPASPHVPLNRPSLGTPPIGLPVNATGGGIRPTLSGTAAEPVLTSASGSQGSMGTLSATSNVTRTSSVSPQTSVTSYPNSGVAAVHASHHGFLTGGVGMHSSRHHLVSSWHWMHASLNVHLTGQASALDAGSPIDAASIASDLGTAALGSGDMAWHRTRTIQPLRAGSGPTLSHG